MNPISLAMDGLLAVLLLTAVAVGVRLNGKLKLLREGQGQFVRAVGELDAAAARAETGLQALRSATEEAHDALLARIETARGLVPRLDRAGEEAAAAVARLEEGVRAADAAGRRAQVAARSVEEAAARPSPVRDAPLAAARPAAAEPIPFPVLAREPTERGLAAALRAAERVVEAQASPAVQPEMVDDRPTTAPAATAGGDRLARFVARRRSARA